MKVLFVDDQKQVLQGFRRLILSLNLDWQVEFEDQPLKVIEHLDHAKFDIIVSDMRMPKLNGAQLLEMVANKHPYLIRIILSGHSDQKMILETVPNAHQFLAKPCQAEELISTINRAYRSKQLLENENLCFLITGTRAIPSLPENYFELEKELKNSDPDMKKIGSIISSDVGLVGNILHVVNSAFFGLPRKIESPLHAINLLGIGTIKGLVLQNSINSQINPENTNLCLKTFSNHCLQTAVLAKKAANLIGFCRDTQSNSFIAGILHDVGKLILSINLRDKYEEVLTLFSNGDSESIVQIEQEVIGATHCEVGAYLLSLWGLEDSIIDTVAFHHNPSEQLNENNVLTAVHIANSIEHSNAGVIPYDSNYLLNKKIDSEILHSLESTFCLADGVCNE